MSDVFWTLLGPVFLLVLVIVGPPPLRWFIITALGCVAAVGLLIFGLSVVLA